MTKAATIAAALALGAIARVAAAHVTPSVDDNNRYVKVQPLGDRVRIAYTVFFGEVPGAGMRPQIDANHDKTISDAEAQAFGAKLAKEVAANLELTFDGSPRAVAWSEVAVGMGTPAVAAGTFSVDLVGWVCASRGKHALVLRDHFRLQRPGETEIKIEDSPGVTIERGRVGPQDAPDHDYRFTGAATPIADAGLDLVYTASDRAPVTPDVACAGAPPGGRGFLVAIGVGVGLAVLALGGLVVARRRRGPRA